MIKKIRGFVTKYDHYGDTVWELTFKELKRHEELMHIHSVVVDRWLCDFSRTHANLLLECFTQKLILTISDKYFNNSTKILIYTVAADEDGVEMFAIRDYEGRMGVIKVCSLSLFPKIPEKIKDTGIGVFYLKAEVCND
jgi:hypothetical protein